VYRAQRQRNVLSGWSTTLVVRVRGDAGALAGPLRQLFRDLDSNLPVYDIATLEGTIREHHSPLRMAALGIAGGLVLATGAAQVLRSMVRGLDPLNAALFSGVALLLAAVTLLAAYLPARRATRVDPMVALRAE
jgi:hypothetical protein